jgi:hypothetical protein
VLHTLGNLALISGTLNGMLSNKPWSAEQTGLEAYKPKRTGEAFMKYKLTILKKMGAAYSTTTNELLNYEVGADLCARERAHSWQIYAHANANGHAHGPRLHP